MIVPFVDLKAQYRAIAAEIEEAMHRVVADADFVLAADVEPILSIARKHDLIVIEDACQAHGARYKGKSVGAVGDAGCFSFYPGKNLGAYGDAGMIVTNSKDVADKIRLLRNYGQPQKYQHVMMGYNRRLDSLQAAVLRAKLRHLDDWNAARRRAAKLYD